MNEIAVNQVIIKDEATKVVIKKINEKTITILKKDNLIEWDRKAVEWGLFHRSLKIVE